MYRIAIKQSIANFKNRGKTNDTSLHFQFNIDLKY